MDEEKTKPVLRMTREAIEAKMHARDYNAARTLVLDARKTSPSWLHQASEMLTVCDILCAAQLELPGSGIDWYWILQLYSAAEPSAIGAQYQKIVSLLKPIMHDFPGTELALNFASDAFSVLSDPERRAAFDSKRSKVFQNKVTAKPTSPSSSSAGRVDTKWTPDDFSADQVWAVYDGAAVAMPPRHYVKVVAIVSSTQVRVAFLEPQPTLDQEMQWVEEGLLMACGVFRAGRSTSILDMSKFSHTVDCERRSLTKKKKLFYRIFPRKGQVWAMYKDWNINWKTSDLNLDGCQCHMVEILSDFSEESGVSMCCLVEVLQEGRLTSFFQRRMHDGFQLFKQASRLELLSFSHRVPASFHGAGYYTRLPCTERNVAP